MQSLEVQLLLAKAATTEISKFADRDMWAEEISTNKEFLAL